MGARVVLCGPASRRIAAHCQLRVGEGLAVPDSLCRRPRGTKLTMPCSRSATETNLDRRRIAVDHHRCSLPFLGRAQDDVNATCCWAGRGSIRANKAPSSLAPQRRSPASKARRMMRRVTIDDSSYRHEFEASASAIRDFLYTYFEISGDCLPIGDWDRAELGSVDPTCYIDVEFVPLDGFRSQPK